VRWDVSLTNLEDCEIKLFDAIDYFNAPASESFISGKLAQLRSVMARTSETNDDIMLVLTTYGQQLRGYPADIIAYVIDNTIRTKKWFPLVCDLIKEIEQLVGLRRSIMRIFEDCRRGKLALELGKYISAG